MVATNAPYPCRRRCVRSQHHSRDQPGCTRPPTIITASDDVSLHSRRSWRCAGALSIGGAHCMDDWEQGFSGIYGIEEGNERAEKKSHTWHLDPARSAWRWVFRTTLLLTRDKMWEHARAEPISSWDVGFTLVLQCRTTFLLLFFFLAVGRNNVTHRRKIQTCSTCPCPYA